jgi:hypothetical protein
MGSVRELRRQRQVGDVAWHAAISLRIGDDDTVYGVVIWRFRTASAT